MRWAAAAVAAAVFLAGCGSAGRGQSPQGTAIDTDALSRPPRAPDSAAAAAAADHDHPDLYAVGAEHLRIADHDHTHPGAADPDAAPSGTPGRGSDGPASGQAGRAVKGVFATQPGRLAPARSSIENRTAPDRSAGAGAWTVEYTSQGTFVPERLDITTGDTVVFVNASQVPVWPASNIHPTHEILSSFDPRRAVAPGESWSYTFDENGYWRYHNHIEASQTGLVVASGGPEADFVPLDTRPLEVDFATPPVTGVGGGLMDDEAELERYVLTYGPAAALEELKAAELSTGRDCHDAAHEVGHIAYEQFGASAFALAGHDCHAGALHGTIESLFAERGTSRLASDVAVICAFDDNSFLVHQCLHGVGHGLLAWTTYELPEALELCDLMPTSANRWSCYGGVHMENGIGGLSGLMGHTTEYLDADDPHFPCSILAEHHKPGCYFWQTSNLFFFGYETPAVVAFCDEAPEASLWSCFWSLGRDLGSIHRDDPVEAASQCRLAGGRDRILDCFRGLALSRFTEAANAAFSSEVCTIADLEVDPLVADGCWEVVLRDAPDIFIDPDGMRAFCDGIVIDTRRDACRAAVRL